MLRKSPVRTPALIAANRRNALKSTGPRTVAGKARVALNGLKNGRYASHLHRRPLLADDWERAWLYRGVRSVISRVYSPSSLLEYRDCERMASEVWCHLSCLLNGSGPKPESPLESNENSRRIPGGLDGLRMLLGARLPSSLWAADRLGALLRRRGKVNIRTWPRRLGVTFWVQRRRFWTVGRIVSLLQAGEDLADESVLDRPARAEFEDVPRFRVYRLARPTLGERLQYGLDRDGNHYPVLVALCRPLIRQLRAAGKWPLP